MPEQPSRHGDPSRARLHSFIDAFRGLGFLLKTQPNARIHAVLGFAVVITGWWLKLSRVEWIAVLLSIGFVLAAESINTALELLADRITTLYDPLIGHAKDLAAGAVLIASLAAAAVGAIVLLPKLIAFAN